MNTNLDEVESLLFDWESDSLDDQGVDRIREILREDAAARTHFVQLQMIDAAMELETEAGLVPPVTSENHATPVSGTQASSAPHASISKRPAISRGFWLVSALSLLVCLLGGWLVILQLFTDSPVRLDSSIAQNTQQRDATQEATSQGVALITRLVDVAWDDDQRVYEVGDALSPGGFSIQGGHAQVEFFCGATVVIQGPAELDIESATRARVRSGRLRAHVPPAARGFSLDVNDMKVVDLGTEFALSVSPAGTNVQVFDGEVELHRRSHAKQFLKAGQGIVRSAEGSYQAAPITPETFVDIAGLESRARLQRSSRYQRWKKWSDEVRRDSRLIAYYAFDREGDWERRLASSNEPVNRELDGAIVGARGVPGRWDEKPALEFKRPADRVRVQIPGQYSSLTLACWTKIDSLDRWFNSLFLTDNYDHGEPHWQILDSGQIYFSVRPAKRGNHQPRDYKVLSPPFWQASMSGKWLHLATTYDAASGLTTHYLNGEQLHAETIPVAQRVSTTTIGAASIGNWASPTMPDAKFAIRNLNGSIDELAIFAAALTSAEIHDMYENGRP